MVRLGGIGFSYVNGKPTDCVHLALTGLLEAPPDIVISGINQGANMGDDTIYSGTVAAATEGFVLGISGIAVSLVVNGGDNYATAGAGCGGGCPRWVRAPRGRSPGPHI